MSAEVGLPAKQRAELAMAVVRDRSMGLLSVTLENVARMVAERPDDEDLQFRAMKACTALMPKDHTLTVSEAPDLGRAGTVASVQRLLRLAEENRAVLERGIVEGEVVDERVPEEYAHLL